MGQKVTKPFRFVDLFAGIGGFHAVLGEMGGELAVAVEIDQKARATYKRNWGTDPEVDVVEMANSRIEEVGEHVVLAGGFPCQPFSKSGRQLGMTEHRGQMFDEIVKIARRYRPPVVFLENVRNLVGPRQSATWDHIVSELRESGYRVSSQPLIASPHRLSRQNGGAPQSRERVYIFGTYVGRDRALAETDIPPVQLQTANWDPRSWALVDYLETDVPVGAAFRFSREEQSWLDLWNDFLHRMEGIRLPGFPLWSMYWDKAAFVDDGAPAWKQRFERQNLEFYREHREIIDAWKAENPQLQTFPASRRKFEWQAQDSPHEIYDLLIHLRPSGIRVKSMTYAPALVAMAQIPLIGPLQRRMTPGETARLQNFPPEFLLDHQPAAASYKQLGNAINVGVAYGAFRAHVLRDSADLSVTARGAELVAAVKKSPSVPSWLASG